MDPSSSTKGSAIIISEEAKVCTTELPCSKGPLPETAVAQPSPPLFNVSSPCVTAASNTAEQISNPVVSEPYEHSKPTIKASDGTEDRRAFEDDLSVEPREDYGEVHNRHTDEDLGICNKQQPTTTKGIVDHTADQHIVMKEEAESCLGATIKVKTPSKDESPVDMGDTGEVDAAQTRNLCVWNIEPFAFAQEEITKTEAIDVQDDKKAKVEQHQPAVATGMSMSREDLIQRYRPQVANKVELSNDHSPLLSSRKVESEVTPTDAPSYFLDTGFCKDKNPPSKRAKAMEITKLAVKNGSSINAVEGREEGDGAFGDDEETAVETSKDAPLRSVPPHMRLTSKPVNLQQSDTQGTRREWPAPVPRVSRAYYPPAGYQPSRPPMDYDELQRTKSQLMKTRDDLECERKANVEMQKTVGAEKQATIGAAMSNMLTDLLHKQAEALAGKAKTEEKERDLQYRERRIAQLEEYLAYGQRQLKYQLEQQGIQPMSVVEQANLRRQVELKIRHQLSDIEGKITIQVEHLRHQEAAQKIREQQYKTLVRDAIEVKVRAQVIQDEQTRIADTKAVEAAYERGFAEGKRTAGASASSVTSKQEFLKGYAACYRSQAALYNMRHGRIATDSPELAFLYDPMHLESPHNVGLQIGRMENMPHGGQGNAMGAFFDHKSTSEGAAKEVVAYQGRGQAESSNSVPLRSTQIIDHAERAHETQQGKPTSSTVPQRSTFASELRGSSSATSKATFARNATTTTTGLTGNVVGGIYAEHCTIHYEEDSDIESASPNLIDLY